MNKKMYKALACGVLISCMTGAQALAADAAPKAAKMPPGTGNPVNSSIAGGAIAPKGMLLTVLNFSYKDKDNIRDRSLLGADAATMTSMLYLLKIRYSPLDRLELIFVPGFVSNEFDAFGAQGSRRVDGPTDFNLGATYSILSQRLGDPLSFTWGAGFNMPTGQNGSNHLPGGDAWGFNTRFGLSKIWHPCHRVDFDLVLSQPLERGNGEVRKDTVYSFNGSYHYVFNKNFDIGAEFTLDKGNSWDNSSAKWLAGPGKGKSSMNNGYTELYAGPVANYTVPQWNMWFGAGVFFPVVRDYDKATASDDYRIELKVGKTFQLL